MFLVIRKVKRSFLNGKINNLKVRRLDKSIKKLQRNESPEPL
jgi:hypothetical protein